MKKLEDITYRHELIERYLDADTQRGGRTGIG